MVAEQAQILEGSASRPGRDPRDDGRREPPAAPRAEVRGETRGDRYVEPRIGPAR
ncbi:hypothetical protein D3C71_2066280 [compost metagenome]